MKGFTPLVLFMERNETSHFIDYTPVREKLSSIWSREDEEYYFFSKWNDKIFRGMIFVTTIIYNKAKDRLEVYIEIQLPIQYFYRYRVYLEDYILSIDNQEVFVDNQIGSELYEYNTEDAYRDLDFYVSGFSKNYPELYEKFLKATDESSLEVVFGLTIRTEEEEGR